MTLRSSSPIFLSDTTAEGSSPTRLSNSPKQKIFRLRGRLLYMPEPRRYGSAVALFRHRNLPPAGLSAASGLDREAPST
jgi:hypothetical protein